MYLGKQRFNRYWHIRRMYVSVQTPSVLWTHEMNPKYTHRIDMKIGHFIACSLSDWATEWTSKGIRFLRPAVLTRCYLQPKPNRF